VHFIENPPNDQNPSPWYRVLYIQVLIAIALGVAIGHFFPGTGVALKPLGDGFIALIKMMIAATLQKIAEGWILLTQAGVRLEPDTFRTLGEIAQDHRPVFALPKCLTERHTRNGTPIHAQRSQAILFRAELANDLQQQRRGGFAPLTLVRS